MRTGRATGTMGLTLVVTAGAVLGAVAASPGDGTDPTDPTGVDEAAAGEPATASVVVDDLTAEYQATADVTHGDPWTLPLDVAGIVTAAPEPGDVVDSGGEIVRVDERPVHLGRGDTPMYRELRLVGERLTGDDVAAVQRFLLDAGFDDGGAMTVDGEFGPATRDALRDWQDSVGLDDTGRIGPDDLVLAGGPLRIDRAPRIGTRFDAIEVTGASALVELDLAAEERRDLPVGAGVELEVADGSVVAGTVTDQRREIGGDGSPQYHTVIETATDLDPDESSVIVRRTVVEADDVLVVPTSALLAVAEGGFALEVVGAGGSTHLVAVEVGAVVDARAEVSGRIAAGDTVVVAR